MGTTKNTQTDVEARNTYESLWTMQQKFCGAHKHARGSCSHGVHEHSVKSRAPKARAHVSTTRLHPGTGRRPPIVHQVVTEVARVSSPKAIRALMYAIFSAVAAVRRTSPT